MAYVRKTQTLIDDVANTVNSMMQAEMSKQSKANDVSIGTDLHRDIAELYSQESWKLAPDIKDKMPDEWCKLTDSVDIRFVNGDDYNNVRLELGFPDNAKLKLPPTFNRYSNAISIEESSCGALVKEWLAKQHNLDSLRSQTREMFGGIEEQLTKFLGRHASLNTAIKEMPELKLYVPDEYIRKLEQKSTPRTQSPVQSAVEDLDIDLDNITRLAVAHRLTKGATNE